VNEASARAAAASDVLAAKATAIGAAGAAKAAAVSKQTYAAAGSAAGNALEAGKAAGSKLESALSYVDDQLDRRGVKRSLKDTTGAIVDKLDTLIGKQLLEMLETRLQAQDKYNDILATRLAEALQRIERLEAEVRAHVSVPLSNMREEHRREGGRK